METKIEYRLVSRLRQFCDPRRAGEGLSGAARPAHKIVLTSGIGQAAKMPQYLDVNYFNGLHGRSLPLAAGIKLARPDLTVIAYSGDGCMYGEGGNHFIHTIRRRLDITILVSDNQVYALTKGQSSPTTDPGVKNDLDPRRETRTFPSTPSPWPSRWGPPSWPAVLPATRSTSKELIREAILFPGTALVDILQPCVSFNKVNTYQWYKERVFKLEKPLTDRYEALRMADTWGEKIPIGVLYRNDAAPCREVQEIFGKQADPADVACRADMTCVMMR